MLSLYLSSPPPLGRRKKEACAARIGTPSVEGLLYCSFLSMLPFWLSTTKTFVLFAFLRFTAVPTHLSLPSIAMAEMADLATALDKLEVTKKGESPPDFSAQQTKEASPQASSSSPPASAEKQEEKKSEQSPPASAEKQEEKKPEDSPQPHEEEVTLKVGSGAASEDPSPQESKKPEDSKDPSPPEPKPQDSAEDDLLEFTSATEGEGEASSSAWELVPNERRIARKKGVKSDSEIDSLVKKSSRKPSSQRRGKSPPRRSPPQQAHLQPQPKMLWPLFQRIQQQRQLRNRGPRQSHHGFPQSTRTQ